MNNDLCFLKGFNAVIDGKINEELTTREIQKKFPEIKSVNAFYSGMIDALNDDWFRYDLIELKLS